MLFILQIIVAITHQTSTSYSLVLRHRILNVERTLDRNQGLQSSSAASDPLPEDLHHLSNADCHFQPCESKSIIPLHPLSVFRWPKDCWVFFTQLCSAVIGCPVCFSTQAGSSLRAGHHLPRPLSALSIDSDTQGLNKDACSGIPAFCFLSQEIAIYPQQRESGPPWEWLPHMGAC